MPERTSTPDPEPMAPEKPLASDCCDGGCDCCVFDRYAEENADFLLKHAAWVARLQRGQA